MNRPLSWVALCYAAGLLAGHFLPCPLTVLFALSLTCAASALLLPRARPLLIWPLLLLAGWTNLGSRTAIISPADLRLTQSNRVEIVTVRGTLTQTPSQRIYLRDAEPVARSLAELETTELLRRGARWETAAGRILILTPGALPPEFFGGQRVEITGVLSLPPGAKAQGLFDYRAYLRNQGIYYQLKSTTNDWVLLSAKGAPPWSDRFVAWAQATLARGLPNEDEPLRLLWSMTLGLKNVIERQGYDPFVQTGTMHIFAISGLHIALIAGILVMVLRAVRIPRSWCCGVVLPLIWLYTAATGWQPSAIRSTVMMSIIIFGWALERPSDLLNSLGAAAFIILLWDPQQLFGASFQLSFFVVLSIALFLPPIERARDRLLAHDPLLPAELLPRWQRWGYTSIRWISNSGATSLAAWLGALPITAYYFHMFSPVTLLANLLVVPLSSLALASNVGSIVCGIPAACLSELFNHSAWFWMASIVQVSDWLLAVPKAFLYVRSPAPVDFFIYYTLLLAAFSGLLFARRVRPWAAAGAGLVCCFYLWQWQTSRAVVNITVLPLEGGMSVFASAPAFGPDLLLDTGPTTSTAFELKPFLAAQGVNSVPALVLSHGDTRHIGGAETLAGLLPVQQVCISPVPQRSPNYRTAVQHFGLTPNLLRKLSRLEHVGPWTVLNPAPEDRFSKADDAAIVLLGQFHGLRLLLLSDLGRAGQDALLERTPDLHADIVVAGLPATGEPLCEALLDAIRPHAIIVADSEFPAYERASRTLLDRLGRRKTPLVSTRSAGAVTITARKGQWHIRGMDGSLVSRP